MRTDSETGATSARSASGLWLLASALVLGLLRYWKLGEWSLWHDEAITWADAHHAVDGGRLYNPLGYLLIRSTVAWLGGDPSEWALRLAPAVAGQLCIALAWWAFRPLCGGRRAGLIALLMAVSSWQLYWAQNARFYTFAAALGLLGGGLWMRSWLDGNRRRALLGALVLALAAWVQLSAGLLVAGLLAAPFAAGLAGRPLPASARPLLRGVLIGGAVALLAASPWVHGVWSTYTASKATGAGLGARLGGLGHFALTTGYYVGPIVAGAFALGTWHAWRTRDAAVWAALVAWIGCAGGALASLGAVVSAQYVFVLHPWILAGAVALLPSGISRATGVRGAEREAAARGAGAPGPAAALERAADPDVRRLAAALAALLVLPALVDSLLYFSGRYGGRERWREAWHYVAEARRPGDLVAGMAAPIGEYYLAPGATDLRHPRAVAWIDKHRADLPDRWSQHARRAWYVIRPDSLATWEAADRDAFRAHLREECRLMQRFPVRMEGRDLDVEVWLHEAP